MFDKSESGEHKDRKNKGRNHARRLPTYGVYMVSATNGKMILNLDVPAALARETAKTKRISPTVRLETPGQSRSFVPFAERLVCAGRINHETTAKGMTRIAMT